ncbi:SDR family NAD(P)-dependent oxidoreductase [Rasiella sp. SM2506]|uniref:SDR family NAD(P)-dependent oxidoreductase n=1 Tax=Rasiella sp. SM2506 TaxID=3423914 RepID=UPI003D79C052
MIVLGSNSDIARAFVEKMLEKEAVPHVYLFSSNIDALASFKKHIEVKYTTEVTVFKLDLLEQTKFDFSALTYNVAFCAAGYLGDTSEGVIAKPEDVARILQINYAGLVPHLNAIAKDLENKGGGNLVCLSSVAGERGRQSNFIYGSAKAGLTAYLSGLRNLLAKKNVHVMTVKPGFMDTKMTKGMDLPGPLTISPEKAATLIYKGYKGEKNTIYISGIWRLVMFIIRNIPEFIFKKLSL